MDSRHSRLKQHQAALKACQRCPAMIGPPIVGQPVLSSVLLVGQAPGDKEGVLGRPFAWTAGKTLFKWFSGIGLDEAAFRERAYMAAVCRCFPGKNPKGGDRVPDLGEIGRCSAWLEAELGLLRPKLVIPVGKLAIQQFLPVEKLDQVVGVRHALRRPDFESCLIPLPHPSGASTWHRREPGKSLLEAALRLIAAHPAWLELQAAPPAGT